MAESIVGDITPDDGISKKDKQYQEEVTILFYQWLIPSVKLFLNSNLFVSF